MATSPKPPTSLIGVPDQWSQWNMIVSDFAETIGDVMWPTSVWTYSQMRRDPRLAAILAAYTLPIRRATWTVDPAGCRDEVVRLVADDLGLPVLGDDKPGPARMRGVSWTQHVRLALLNLTFGHMGFELGGEINAAGQFRLTDIAERMPNSISHIHIDKASRFGGISQWTTAGQDDVPDIPASRMAWYTHEREGSQWQGHSMLRPAYAPWLLKREMQRVHATSNRRFGMGVPVVRALPGTNPTPAQFQAAQEIAQSMRAGDQAGAALPPGFIIELVGLSGSVPDTPAFLDWLNGEMSTSTLTQFMDLGRTETGSRALGNVFVDYFLLSDQAVADELADTATRDIAGKLVGWNWGDDEPVPRLTVADIGTRHEVTAEAIGLLLTSGAIAPDPELEKFVRGEFGFPQRTTPAPAPKPAADPAPIAAGGPRDRTADILSYVTARPVGVRAAEVEKEFGSTARKTLARLATAGRITRASRGVYAPIAAVEKPGKVRARNYVRDGDGKFSEVPGEDVDVDPDEEDGEVEEPDEFGNDTFPQAYRDKYGKVVAQEGAGARLMPDGTYGTAFAIAVTDKQSLHIAYGDTDRKVLVELTPKQARGLAATIYDVDEAGEDGATTDKASGVQIDRTGDQYTLTWPDGSTSDFNDADQVWELGETAAALESMADEYEEMFGKRAKSLVEAARAKPCRRGVPKAAAGTSGQSGLSRDLTDIEVASGVDFAAIQANWDAAKAELLAQWPTLAAPIRDELVAAVTAAIAASDLAALGALTASSAALADAIATVMQDTATTSAAGVVEEAASQGVTVDAPVVELALVAGAAAAIAGVIVGGLASAAARAALQHAAPDADPAAVGQAVANALDAMATSTDGWIADNLGQAVTVAQSTGRGAALEAAPQATYYASEVMDHNTCDPCYDVDGKKFVNLALAQAEYALGGYANCLGGLRCRGIILCRWES